MSAEKKNTSAKPAPEAKKSAFPSITIAVVLVALAAGGIMFLQSKDKDGQEETESITAPVSSVVEESVTKKPVAESTEEAMKTTLTEKKPVERKEPELPPAKMPEEPAQLSPAPATAGEGTEPSGMGTTTLAQSIPSQPAVPVNIPSANQLAGQVGASIPKTIKPLSARELTGAQRPDVLPEATRAAMKAKRERLMTEQQISEMPEELISERPEAIGQAFLPDGSRKFMVFDEEGNTTKVVTISKDGEKSTSIVGQDGKVTSMTVNETVENYSYETLPDGSTLVTVTDEAGILIETREYNDRNLLVSITDDAGESLMYKYTFEGETPVAYSVIDAQEQVVDSGDYNSLNNVQLSNLVVSGKSTAKTFNYEYDENGTLTRIIENKDTESEVIRDLDENKNLISLKKTGQKLSYDYEYDAQNELVKITIHEADGTVRVIDKTDPDFDMMKSETEVFDPIKFSDMMREQQNLKQYRDQNLLNQELQKTLQYKAMPSAQDLQQPVTAPAVPVTVPGVDTVNTPTAGTSPAGVSAPAKPATPPSGGVSVPKRY
ncbi:MAG: hypothetical protein AB1454_11080 [Candidatus Auribacterota bacterium]